MEPRISILVPSYNHAPFLRTALDGVLAQTLHDWELIIIDDGSTDESVEIARSYDDPRIHVEVNPTNLGTYGTEQKALDQAKGEFVAILNSDDLWASQKLAKQIALLESHPEASFCYTLGSLIDLDGNVVSGEDVHLNWPKTKVQQLLPFLVYENRILASSVLFRRKALRFDTSCRYSGDWVALLEQSRRGPAVCVTEQLTFWRQHETNTYLRSEKQYLEEIRVRRAIARQPESWYLPPIDPTEIRQGLAMNALNLTALYSFCLDARNTRKMARLAMRLHAKKAMKRAIGVFLPMRYVREHLRGEDDLGWISTDEPSLRKAIKATKPLAFSWEENEKC
jgi:glycosyltransferase involved in cell wall biosynthesis